jgi:AbrB family looped-hinge helix DNA binding protein
MSTQTVKVSARYQIAVPSVARERLNIKQGDRLIVDVQDGVIILTPEPSNYAERLAGLHSDVWEGVDSDQYLQAERNAWDDSATD